MDGYETHTEFTYKENEISLRDFLGDDFYDDLVAHTDNDKQKMLSILDHYADKSGFFERIREYLYE